MGFTTFLTTPFMQNRQRDFFGHEAGHGYWPIDHFKIDPRWGTWPQVEEFISHNKALGHKFLLDVVLNHVDWDHPWVQEHPEYFHTLGPIKNWDDEQELREGQVSGLPDLQQDHDEVYAYLLRYTKFWLQKTQANGIRFDAVKHIGHPFWQKFIQDLKDDADLAPLMNRDFIFLAEILHGDPKTYLPYLQDGFNAFYNYPLYYTLKEVFAENAPLFNLAARLQQIDHTFPPEVLLANFIDNHDMPRFLDVAAQVGVSDLKQALSVLYAVRGMPVIYAGTEALVRGKTGEEGRKMFSLKMGKNALYPFLQKLNRLRQQHPALALGPREDVLVTAESYVFIKRDPREEVWIVIARPKVKNGRVKIQVPGQGGLRDLNTGKKYTAAQGKFVWELGKQVLFLARPLGPKASLAPADRPTIPLTFILKDAPANLDQVSLVGNLPALGEWQPGQAKKLLSSHLTIYVHPGEVLEYKFIGQQNGEVVWEARPNRQHFVQGAQTITCQWNK
ncbi:MAG: hypothetical protein J6Y94_06605 [Bacteriovoracaceae bacterium]|nr:hypothetical protein [Bacteriovoracaceae bacterium]